MLNAHDGAVKSQLLQQMLTYRWLLMQSLIKSKKDDILLTMSKKHN